jgi:hypothetical protein
LKKTALKNDEEQFNPEEHINKNPPPKVRD